MGSFSDKSRAMLYVRVSTKEQVEEGNSLPTQERICREYASRNDMEIIEEAVFVEEGESAKTALRTELQKMLTYATLHKDSIDCLIIYRLDRLSRDTRDYGELKVFFSSLGIKVVSATENFDDNPVGRFIENTLAGVAQLDNEVRAERSKNGMIDAVREGRWVWKAPLGYVNTKVNGKRNIAPNTENDTAKLLNEAWVLVDTGYPIGEARRILTNKGLVNAKGKPVCLSYFHKIFRKTIYKGVMDNFGLNVISDSIVPIVKPELYDRVLAKLDTPQKNPEVYKTANPEFPLRGVVYCKEGHRMSGSSPRGNGGRYPKYHCPKCRGEGTSHSKELVENEFVTYLNTLEYQHDLKDALVVAIEENWAMEQQSSRRLVRKLKKRLLELDGLDNEIARKNLNGVFNDEHTKKLLAQNNLERIEIKLELGKYQNLDKDLEEIIEFGASSLEQIGSIWSDLEDIFVKQRFQKWLFPSGIVWNGEKFGTNDLPLCVSIKQKLRGENSLMVTSRRIELRLPG